MQSSELGKHLSQNRDWKATDVAGPEYEQRTKLVGITHTALHILGDTLHIVLHFLWYVHQGGSGWYYSSFG